MTHSKNGVCHIVGAGDFDSSLIHIQKEDFLIAADGGYHHLTQCGLAPHLFVGDSDSLGFVPQDVESKVLPKVKDDTDTLSATREGLARGYRRFCYYGVLGGKRFSHSLSALQVLTFLSSVGAEGEILDTSSRIRLLTEGDYTLNLARGYFSLFSFAGKTLLSIENARYEGTHLSLSPEFPLGTSNEGRENTKIRIHSGSALLVFEPNSLRPDGTDS